MSNFKVYSKTLSFSLVMFLVDLVSLGILVGLSTAGYFIGASDGQQYHNFIGLGIGLVVGIVISVVISYLIQNRFKAAQIAMMTRGVTEDSLPDHTFSAGLSELKGRFGKITLFFVITNAIKSVFREIGRGMTKLGQAVGGDVGGGVASAIDSGVQTVIAYLCDCCLGWVLYRKDMNSFRAACEGAVIFFRHGKTLIRNVGRIFGMGLLSLIVFGGGFFGIFFLIFRQFPQMFVTLSQEIQKLIQSGSGDVPTWLYDPQILSIVVAAIGGLIIFGFIHGVFIRPFILVGVLRNFMNAGKAHIPTDAEIGDLEKKFPKFSKLTSRAK